MQGQIIKYLSKSFFLRKVVYLCHYLVNKIRIKGARNRVVYQKGALVWNMQIVVKGEGNEIIIGPNTSLNNFKITIEGNNSTVNIGEGVFCYESAELNIEGNNACIDIDRCCTFGSVKMHVAEDHTAIIMGADCMVSREVSINTSDFHTIMDLEQNKRINPPKKVVVKDHVWIGNGATINKGAEIGSNCVIATNAVVSGKFEDNTVIAGVPAKVIRSGVTWSRKLLPYENK